MTKVSRQTVYSPIYRTACPCSAFSYIITFFSLYILFIACYRYFDVTFSQCVTLGSWYGRKFDWFLFCFMFSSNRHRRINLLMDILKINLHLIIERIKWEVQHYRILLVNNPWKVIEHSHQSKTKHISIQVHFNIHLNHPIQIAKNRVIMVFVSLAMKMSKVHQFIRRFGKNLIISIVKYVYSMRLIWRIIVSCFSQELLHVIAFQSDLLKKRDTRLKDLENYTDTLLVKILEQCPTILQVGNSSSTSSHRF